MTIKPRAVILAAGESKRMQGSQKLLMPFRGKPMIEYVIEAAHDWDPVVVASPEVAAYLAHHRGLAILVNEHPRKGMSHSLYLADKAVAAGTPLLVLLADKPLGTRALIAAVESAADGADIAHPQRGSEPGHPVYFSAKARARIRSLPRGDSIRLLRDDPTLEHRALAIDDPAAYFDIDLPGGFEAPRE